jgi:hypothetical protein
MTKQQSATILLSNGSSTENAFSVIITFLFLKYATVRLCFFFSSRVFVCCADCTISPEVEALRGPGDSAILGQRTELPYGR